MKQMTEGELRQIISDAYDQGFDDAQQKGSAYDPDEVDIMRDEHIDLVMEGL